MTDLKKLAACPLTTREKETLLVRVNDLLRFLGAPGDWGYGTRLGDLTLDLLSLRAQIGGTATREELDAREDAAETERREHQLELDPSLLSGAAHAS